MLIKRRRVLLPFSLTEGVPHDGEGVSPRAIVALRDTRGLAEGAARCFPFAALRFAQGMAQGFGFCVPHDGGGVSLCACVTPRDTRGLAEGAARCFSALRMTHGTSSRSDSRLTSRQRN